MARFTSDKIAEIKNRLNLVDIVQRYVQLRQVGDRWIGVCPFHQETKPSLSINPELGLFYCFGCHASGDLIDFYCRINGLGFSEGVQELAREAGIDLAGQYDPASGKSLDRQICLDINSLAQKYFLNSFKTKEGQSALEYLQKRGLSPETIDQFGLGWSPEKWEGFKKYIINKGYAPEQGVKAGVLSQNKKGRIYDRFRGRVTFPIYNLSGKVIAFGGRVIGDGEPKYLNSSDTPLFKKGDTLYGLFQARRNITQNKEVILTEGYADVLTLIDYGFFNSCGVLGTALTRQQIKVLSGMCRKIILAFDGDRAGRQAALRSTEMILQAGLKVDVVCLPEDEDVDSLLRSRGSQQLKYFLNKAEDGLVFCLNMIKMNNSPKEIITWAINFLSNLQDISWRAYYLPRLADRLNLSESELRTALKQNGRKQTKDTDSKQSVGRIKAQRDRELLRFAICNPNYLDQLIDLQMDLALQTERGKSFWMKLKKHGIQNILPYLDEGEKRFFVQTKLQENEKKASDQVWNELRDFLLKEQKRVDQQNLQNELKQAQEKGDLSEVNRLLKKYSHFLRGAE